MKKKLSNKYLQLFFCLLITILLVAGCKKKDVTPNPPQVQKATQPNAQIAPIGVVQKQLSSPKVDVNSKSSFNFKAKKDPFKPLITEPEPSAAKATPSKIKGVDALPIQSHEVDKFVVTGIITGLKENKALVIDPAGKGYVVKTGMLIGLYGGRITQITATSVIVTENYSDGKKQKTRKIVMPLAKKRKEISR